jgi:FlaA1/EpsC-like NDP-sugar epimerase
MQHDSHAQDHIQIEFIGLRPGEKLREELLLGSNVTGTGHPMIMRAEEECLSYGQIHRMLAELKSHCDNMDCAGITTVLNAVVSGFNSHEVRYDHVWRKQGQTAGPLLAKPKPKPKIGPAAIGLSNVQELFPDKS